MSSDVAGAFCKRMLNDIVAFAPFETCESVPWRWGTGPLSGFSR
jgi:hypothetical protein